MGAELSTWESVFAAAAMVGVIIWMYPGIKRSMERSKDAPKDWLGAIVPIIAVVAFVMLLIKMV